ncbi:MAG: protein kinase, partial [Clostridia bacterium]|nr:protein kinase [Clostridia bacterium]
MFSRCFGCMCELTSKTDTCPVCGFNNNICENPKECLPLGHLLGDRFTIGKAIGIGSFSVSYIAWDNVEQTPVTVKEFLPADLACHYQGTPSLRFFSDDDREAFFSGLSKFHSLTVELSRLSHLECSHKIIDYVNENDIGYAVMEYLTGQTLKQFLFQYRTLSYCDILDIISPIIRTVSALHDENIFHLSISPDNIFLCDDGRVILLNFASSRFEMFSDISRRSIFLHHGFAPIEMYSDEYAPDQSSDVYSLCAVIYKMLTGAVPPEPFSRCDGTEILTPSELGFTIPDYAQETLMKGLSIHQQDRISSAENLLNGFKINYQKKRKKINLSKKFIISSVAVIAVVLSVLIAVALTNNKPPIVTDNTTASETQPSFEFSSDYKLTPCTDVFDSVKLLKTTENEDVLSDVFVFEKNGLLGLIKTDGTIIEKESHSSIVYDTVNNAILLDGKTYISFSGYPAQNTSKKDDSLLPVFSDKYVWDSENFSMSRICNDSSYPQFVSEGSFIVSDETGKYGLVTRGNVMVDIVYDEALPISCGVSAFRKGDEWSYINIYGHNIFDRTFKSSDFGGKDPFSFS